MPGPGSHLARSDVDADLDGLAPGNAEIVPLEIGAFRSSLLRVRHVQHKTACDNQHGCR
jgi:hypothetical protein